MSSRSSDDPGQEGVFDRRLYFCPRLQSFGVNELILTCPCCQGFFLYCCHCSLREGNLEDGPCHHYPLVLTDGACRNNGKEDATAGIGFVFGTLEDQQYGIPVTTDMDDFAKQTSQRAELLAAINGLQYMCEVTRANAEDALNTVNNPHKTIIVATDSQYVVSGITTWFPDWKANNWRNRRGLTPANLELFHELDELITKEEENLGVVIGFWHIPRDFNGLADALAKKASSEGDLAQNREDSSGRKRVHEVM